jgi:hypothetical protein
LPAWLTGVSRFEYYANSEINNFILVMARTAVYTPRSWYKHTGPTGTTQLCNTQLETMEIGDLENKGNRNKGTQNQGQQVKGITWRLQRHQTIQTGIKNYRKKKEKGLYQNRVFKDRDTVIF